MFEFLKRKKKEATPPTASELDEEQLDFDELVKKVAKLSPRAQASMMYRIIEVLPPGVVATTRNYASRKLSDYDTNTTLRSKNGDVSGDHPTKRASNR